MRSVSKIMCSGLLVLFCQAAMAQVKDIGQTFTKRGYIQNIDYAQKVVLVNFIEEAEIVTEVLFIKDNSQFVNREKGPAEFKDIKCSDEVIVEGERFNVDKYSEATKITLVGKNVHSIKEGRIDFIQGDIAYVDGNKVKLMQGKKIKGQKKSGYEKKSFSTVNELKLFDFANISGKYKDSFLSADEFTIFPNNDTHFDKTADTIDKEIHHKFSAAWADPNKRGKFFGTDIPGIGKVYADAAVQDYVHKLGMKMVPAGMKEKTQFLFVVVENPELNANIRANGLCYVYTGLLRTLDNEAQLASILGHEIAHVIYEHVSKEKRDREKAEARKELVADGSGVSKNVIHKAGNLFNTKNKNQSDSERVVIEKNRQDLTLAALSLLDRKLATFSIEDETQADRVGLTIMALAGYDPRQAATTWKTIYDRYGVLIKEEKVKAGKALRKAAAADKTNNKGTKKKSSFITTTGEILSVLIRWKAADYKMKSYRTHPDHIKRFEALNQQISLYWNEDTFLEKTLVGEDEYTSVMKKLQARPKK